MYTDFRKGKPCIDIVILILKMVAFGLQTLVWQTTVSIMLAKVSSEIAAYAFSVSCLRPANVVTFYAMDIIL